MTRPIHLCDKRKAILKQRGHILVTGGPGSGKTTIALLKARQNVPRLKPGQAIAFLSFSRAAVRQIRNRMPAVLDEQERRVIEVSTYHRFCLELLLAHGRLLNGRIPRILTPLAERLRKQGRTEAWAREQVRLAEEEGIYCFDQFARFAAILLERSDAVRKLVADRYPLIVLDEFQDTNNDQWRLVKALARESQLLCLADPDQRIFEYRGDVDPARLELLRQELTPACFDLASENHRSPGAAILAFADAVLRKKQPPASEPWVRIVRFNPQSNDWRAAAHAALIRTFGELRRLGLEEPTIAVLARTNDTIARLSAALLQENRYNGRRLKPWNHEVVWDSDLTAAAGHVIASIMEWPARDATEGVAQTLVLVSEYFRIKNADRPHPRVASLAADFAAAARTVRAGKVVLKEAPRLLVEAAEQTLLLTGNPVEDWRIARAVISKIQALSELAETSRMLRLFRATDTLSAGLQQLWLRQGNYLGASSWLRRAIERERLSEGYRPVSGCVLMNMHKSKGKEFDGVLIVEWRYPPLIQDGREEEQSRRLLRVAITRARHRVVLVRPYGATPLTG